MGRGSDVPGPFAMILQLLNHFDPEWRISTLPKHISRDDILTGCLTQEEANCP